VRVKTTVVHPSGATGLVVEYLPAYGYAEALAGVSPVVALHAPSDGKRLPALAELRLPELDWTLAVRAGAPVVPSPLSPTTTDRLEALPRRMAAGLEVRLDGTPAARVPVALLPAREWPHHPEARRLVAAHACPGDDVVFRTVADAGPGSLPEIARSGSRESVAAVMRALHERLASAHDIAYETPRVSLDPECGTSHQTVRSPQEIAGEPGARRGRGNCLDLTLLFASCLESVGLGPLILFEGETSGAPTHAWIGAWADAGERHRPLLADGLDLAARAAAGEILTLESTSVCAGDHRFTFDEAVAAARARMWRAGPVHAVDVRASRPPRGGVRPLSPANEATVQAAYWAAEALRERCGARSRETLHILYGLCAAEGPLVRRMLESSGSRTQAVCNIIEKSLPQEHHQGPGEETASHRVTRETARSNARNRGSAVVEEGDVLWAVLDSPSRNVRKVLEASGCDASALVARLDREWNRPRDVTMSRHIDAAEGGG
jgi:hypothetical protein